MQLACVVVDWRRPHSSPLTPEGPAAAVGAAAAAAAVGGAAAAAAAAVAAVAAAAWRATIVSRNLRLCVSMTLAFDVRS